jgi:hypothetical protein
LAADCWAITPTAGGWPWWVWVSAGANDRREEDVMAALLIGDRPACAKRWRRAGTATR